MVKKADTGAAWLAVEEAVMGHTFTDDCMRDAFDLCRIAHGLLGQHDLDPFAVSPVKAARRIRAMILDHHGHKRGVPEGIMATWATIRTPEAWDPVQWAVKRFRWVKRPRRAPGTYLDAEQRALATACWHTLYFLLDGDKVAYASTRKLALHLSSNKDYVALALRLLTEAGALQIATPATTVYSPRYFLPLLPIDRGS